MVTRHPIERLRLRESRGERPLGYADEVIAAGIVVDGVVELTPEAFLKLRAKFSQPSIATDCKLCLRNLRIEASKRQPGFAEAVLMAGRISAGSVYLKRADLESLRSQYKLTGQ